jgi:UDP-N-acetylmuramate--alanine ligase
MKIEALGSCQKIHMIGIGGSGMFPLAQILHARGYQLSGSDNNESDTLELVREMGIPVVMGHYSQNVLGKDLVVYSAAISPENPERLAAAANHIPTMERSELLGIVSQLYSQAVCISGTHGKTTTSAMLTQVLLTAGKDPSAVIGGKLPLIGGNGRTGDSPLFVCESCEYVDTFLHLSPDYAVVLNIDEDHMEYFKTLERLKHSFRTFAEKASTLVLYNGDDENTRDALDRLEKETRTFGLSPENDYTAANIRMGDGIQMHFDALFQGQPLFPVTVNIPGKHNILNALACVAMAHILGCPAPDIQKGIADFRGAGRRFEVLGKVNGATLADDYAHHPTELGAVLSTARTLPFQRIWAVFQPFTFSRTAMLLEDFARVLSLADRVVLSPIMGSREINTYGISSQDLAEKIPGCVVLDTFDEIADYVAGQAKEGDLILTLGCGDIYKAAKLMLEL